MYGGGSDFQKKGAKTILAPQVKEMMEKFFGCLEDPDVSVREVALTSLSTAAHELLVMGYPSEESSASDEESMLSGQDF